MQELEKILEEIDLYIEAYNSPPYGIEVDGTTDLLAKCATIIRKHMNDGWTPADERLPEEEQEVWVSAKTDCVRRGIYTKHFGAEHKEGFICSDGFMWMNTANAWQPYVVPEPYRPERSDNNDGE